MFVISCDNEGYNQPPFSQFWGVPGYDESGHTRSLNVAAVSFYVDLSPSVNRNKMTAFIDKIKIERPDVRLILFPEATLGYYYRPSNPSEYIKSIAESIPGVTTDVISRKAIEHQIYISFGMAEMSENDLFISQVLVCPAGTIISVHRKNHLTPWDKENGFKAGSGITVDVIDNIKVATIICYDAMFLEIHKKISRSGAELVLLPVANLESPFGWMIPYTNYGNAWVLSANRIGNEDGNIYDGMLYLSTPSRAPRVVSTGYEGYIYGVVKCR